MQLDSCGRRYPLALFDQFVKQGPEIGKILFCRKMRRVRQAGERGDAIHGSVENQL